MTIIDAIIERINELLKQNGMTKSQLVKKCGIPMGTMASLYKKLAKSANLNTIFAIATKGFEISVSQFLNSPLFDSFNI